VAFFPGASGWFAFAATARGVTVHRIDPGAFASTVAAAQALAPLGPALARARRVRLLPYGAADRVSWQAVPWNGRPLLASVELEYGLDVGWGGTNEADKKNVGVALDAASDSRPAALVISNPTGDLPAAALEVQAVVRALASWNVVRLDGPAATREATLAALPKARLMHYAGHAQPGAAGPLSSALVLSGEGRVELGDLLAAPAVPEVVILSACEAAGAERRQPSLMGLAQAFVAAGAMAALAPTQPVRDAEARAFISAFYSALPAFAGTAASAPGETVARMRAAWRAATITLLSPGRASPASGGAPAGRAPEYEQGNWVSFRLLVP
jgi:CHAT domain-containing protein